MSVAQCRRLTAKSSGRQRHVSALVEGATMLHTLEHPQTITSVAVTGSDLPARM